MLPDSAFWTSLPNLCVAFCLLHGFVVDGLFRFVSHGKLGNFISAIYQLPCIFVLMLVFQVMWVSWLHFDLIPLLVPEENFWE